MAMNRVQSREQNWVKTRLYYFKLLCILSLVFTATPVVSASFSRSRTKNQFDKAKDRYLSSFPTCSDNQVLVMALITCDMGALKDGITYQFANNIDFETNISCIPFAKDESRIQITPLYASLLCEDPTISKQMANLILDKGASPLLGRRLVGEGRTQTDESSFYKACARAFTSLVKRMGTKISNDEANSAAKIREMKPWKKDSLGRMVRFDGSHNFEYEKLLDNTSPLEMLIISPVIDLGDGQPFEIIKYLIEQKNSNFNKPYTYHEGGGVSLLANLCVKLHVIAFTGVNEEFDFSKNILECSRIATFLLKKGAKFITELEKNESLQLIKEIKSSPQEWQSKISTEDKNTIILQINTLLKELLNAGIFSKAELMELEKLQFDDLPVKRSVRAEF